MMGTSSSRFSRHINQAMALGRHNGEPRRLARGHASVRTVSGRNAGTGGYNLERLYSDCLGQRGVRGDCMTTAFDQTDSCLFVLRNWLGNPFHRPEVGLGPRTSIAISGPAGPSAPLSLHHATLGRQRLRSRVPQLTDCALGKPLIL